MLEILNATNISIEDIGYGKVVGDSAIVNLHNTTLKNIRPKEYRWTEAMRHFSYYRLYLVTDGQVEFQINNHPFVMTKGKMYLIHPFSIDSAKSPESFTHYYMHFNLKGIPFNFLSYYDLSNGVNFSDDEVALFKQLLHYFHSEGIKKELITYGTFALLFSKFFKSSTKINPAIRKFEPVLNYINENITKNITLEELADIIHMNKVYFATSFQKTFKTTPIKYVIEKKILYAQELLAKENYSIKEIAYKLGYSNEYYFSSAFKHSMGISPNKWRQAYILSPQKNTNK